MRRVGDYFQNYFHNIALEQTEKILRKIRPPRTKYYRLPRKMEDWSEVEIFCYKERLYFYPEDFSDCEDYMMDE